MTVIELILELMAYPQQSEACVLSMSDGPRCHVVSDVVQVGGQGIVIVWADGIVESDTESP